MDVPHHLKLGEPGMGDLVRQHAAGDHSGHLAPGGQDRVRHRAHQPGPGAAVDQPESGPGERVTQFGGGPQVLRAVSG